MFLTQIYRKGIVIVLAAAMLASGGTPARASAILGDHFGPPAAPATALTDGYGYVADNSVGYNWLSASGGSVISFQGQDDSYFGPVSIGFPFKFYENTYNSLYISTNGMITFGEGNSSPANTVIPWAPRPNNFIAPLWADLRILTGQARAKYVDAATDYFIIEYAGVDYPQLNFEVVLYQDGRILFQYNNLPGDGLDTNSKANDATVGIEDEHGIFGLQFYYKTEDLVGGQKAIQFTRPAAAPRVKISPLIQGGFITEHQARFSLDVHNIGEVGADRFNLEAVSSQPGWAVTWYDGNGTTPLKDNTSDGKVDTGATAIAETRSISVTLKIEPPALADEGAYTTVMVTATSVASLASPPVKFMTATVQTAIPVQFAQVYVDASRVGLRQIWEKNIIDRSILNSYTGSTLAMESISLDNYLTAWENLTILGNGDQYTDIQYRVSDRLGKIGPLSNLTEGATLVTEAGVYQADAVTPVIAPAPDSRVGIVWSQTKQRDNGGAERNSNIYLAALDQGGVLISPRTDVTQDSQWYSTVNARDHINPNLAIVGEVSSPRYVVAWLDQESTISTTLRAAVYTYNAGSAQFTPLFSPTVVDSSAGGALLRNLFMIDIGNNQVLMTYSRSDTGAIWYAVFDALSGALARPPAALASATGEEARAVQFNDNDVIVGWVDDNDQVAYAYLDSASNYAVYANYPQTLTPIANRRAGRLSITLDNNGRAVMTWLDAGYNDYLFYSLFDQDGNNDTPPMIFLFDAGRDPLFETSAYGAGNAAYTGIYQGFIPLVRK